MTKVQFNCRLDVDVKDKLNILLSMENKSAAEIFTEFILSKLEYNQKNSGYIIEIENERKALHEKITKKEVEIKTKAEEEAKEEHNKIDKEYNNKAENIKIISSSSPQQNILTKLKITDEEKGYIKKNSYLQKILDNNSIGISSLNNFNKGRNLQLTLSELKEVVRIIQGGDGDGA